MNTFHSKLLCTELLKFNLSGLWASIFNIHKPLSCTQTSVLTKPLKHGALGRVDGWLLSGLYGRGTEWPDFYRAVCVCLQCVAVTLPRGVSSWRMESICARWTTNACTAHAAMAAGTLWREKWSRPSAKPTTQRASSALSASKTLFHHRA